jgi:hypothetical protein
MAETSFNSGDISGHVNADETHMAADVTDKVSAPSVWAKETFSASIEKPKDVASSLVRKVEDVASTFVPKLEEARETVAVEMKSLAGTIRAKAPPAGVLGTAASGAASTLEAGGKYLQEHNFHGLAREVSDLLRRHPLQTIMLGIGVGFLVGRASRR